MLLGRIVVLGRTAMLLERIVVPERTEKIVAGLVGCLP
jgi:hypothetical protein